MQVESRELMVEGYSAAIALRATPLNSQPSTVDLPRRGMTLIELLVVIIIITTLVAAAIPLLSPSNDNRRLREATRGLNTYITGAQARAISLHRPYGIALKRLSQDTNTNKALSDIHPDNGVCLEVFYVEQQSPYAGFDANSRACVAFYPPILPNDFPSDAVLIKFATRGTSTASNQDGLPTGWDADQFPPNMIRPGDVIEINGTQFELLNKTSSYTTWDYDTTGTYYTPRGGNRPTQIVARPLNNSGQQINIKYDNDGLEIGSNRLANGPYWTGPAPYKIFRQPTFTSDEPYQLPEGAAIDLRASGVGVDKFFYSPNGTGVVDVNDNSAPILIMFTPEGRVARVTYSQAPLPVPNNDDETPLFDKPVVDNVFLLVGRRDRIGAPEVGVDPTLDSSRVSAATTDEDRAKLREPINWLSGDSRWVVIGSQSGRVVSVENGIVDMSGVLSNPLRPYDTAPQSTERMRSAQILSAREFTHEMGQLGGR